MSLARQGLALVVVMLVVEIAFLAVLAILFTQAQGEAEKQELLRQVSSKANRLSLVLYDSGDMLGRYTRSLEGDVDNSAKLRQEVPDIIAFLQANLKDSAEAETLLADIAENFKVALPVIAEVEAQKVTLQDSNQVAMAEWQAKRDKIQGNINVVVKDLQKLMKICHDREKNGPDREQESRQLTELVLYAGLALNVLVCALVGFLFVNRIAARLERVSDNIVLFKEGKKLGETLDGDDEIAFVDSVFHDTAQVLKRQMKVLKASEERIRALIEGVPVGIVVLNRSLAIEFINETIEEEFGYRLSQLLGKQLSKLFMAGQVDEIEPGQSLHRNAGRDLFAVRRDGSQFPVDFTLAEIELDSEIKYLAMIADASERFAVKRMRQGFVGMVRQELKLPLEKVSTFLTRFQSGALGVPSPKALDNTKSMEQNIDRLLVLLNDLFDIDKLETGRIDIEPAPTELSGILERSANAVSMFAKKYKVQLQIPDYPMEVYADSNRIVQVLVNLLSNAIKFSPPGSVVSIALRHSPTQVEIAVIDNGRGIPKDKLADVFEAYKQVEAADAKQKGGTGLGLAICKAIIESHHGEIGVESEAGKGCVFYIRLPRFAPAAPFGKGAS